MIPLSMADLEQEMIIRRLGGNAEVKKHVKYVKGR